MTAVKWLIKEIESLITIETFPKWIDIKEQAKEMEKQQEISDEEIEIAAANLANPNADKTDNWIEGSKWYREQLKSK
jgi:hypothetical protein